MISAKIIQIRTSLSGLLALLESKLELDLFKLCIIFLLHSES